ncbi:hypothetical protein GCM10010492_44760 [Saccharothrix mutabilis subsp. mutabilis]|uniref:Uncharacterized protein n=1 Tax=Saccharothrix mutabilis subsp. mutabilis TaxID=66855 RepID=A0ABN0U6X7_9PSEU
MTDTESLIRDALLRQAERTPPPGGVLAALHRPRRSRKPLFLALATAATATAVAVAVTAIPRPALDQASPGAASSEVPTNDKPVMTTTSPAPVGDTASLGYSVSWVPEGVTERQRNFGAYGVQRLWGENSGLTGKSVTFDVQADGELPGTATDPVHGAPASLTEDTLHWRLGGKLLSVQIKGVPDVPAALRRFAESVRPDPTTFTPPVRAEGLTIWGCLVRDSGDWSVGGVVERGEQKYSVGLATAKTPPLWEVTTTTQLTVMGHPAVYEDGRYSSLTVTLAPDRLLGISTLKDVHVPAEELAAVLETVRYELNPDMSWIGR